MKVHELITELAKLNPDWNVYYDHDEYPWAIFDATGVKPVKLLRAVEGNRFHYEGELHDVGETSCRGAKWLEGLVEEQGVVIGCE